MYSIQLTFILSLLLSFLLLHILRKLAYLFSLIPDLQSSKLPTRFDTMCLYEKIKTQKVSTRQVPRSGNSRLSRKAIRYLQPLLSTVDY